MAMYLDSRQGPRPMPMDLARTPDSYVLNADLGSAISKAAVAAYGPGAANMFSDAAINVVTEAIVMRTGVL